MKEFNYKKKNKAIGRGKRSGMPDDHTKKLYKDKKTGTMYHITEMEAFQMKMGLDPEGTDLWNAKLKKPVNLEEVTQLSPAAKVLFKDNKK